MKLHIHTPFQRKLFCLHYKQVFPVVEQTKQFVTKHGTHDPPTSNEYPS